MDDLREEDEGSESEKSRNSSASDSSTPKPPPPKRVEEELPKAKVITEPHNDLLMVSHTISDVAKKSLVIRCHVLHLGQIFSVVASLVENWGPFTKPC